jgi:hypothetical protein
VSLLLCSKFSSNIHNFQNLEASKTNCTGIEEEKNEKSNRNSINNEGNTIDQHKYSKTQFEDDEFDKDTKQGSYDNENAKELSKESKWCDFTNICPEENKPVNYAVQVMQIEQEISIKNFDDINKSWIDKTIHSVYQDHSPLYDTEMSKL